MKKIIALLMILVLAMGMLVACGDKTPATPTADPGTAAPGNETPDGEPNPIPDWTAYDQLIAQIKSSTDFVEREALMHQAEDMLMDTGCIVPIYYYNDIYMQKSDVTGIYSNVYGIKYFYYSDAPTGTLRL